MAAIGGRRLYCDCGTFDGDVTAASKSEVLAVTLDVEPTADKTRLSARKALRRLLNVVGSLILLKLITLRYMSIRSVSHLEVIKTIYITVFLGQFNQGRGQSLSLFSRRPRIGK